MSCASSGGDCNTRCGLKGFKVITYIMEGAHFFSESPFIRTPQLSVLAIEKSYDG